jgi:D-alanyl-D-alanine carboxypeptidase/D-alanyl-D-alanine-endopeptidase (penicillin-binding protein 4)
LTSVWTAAAAVVALTMTAVAQRPSREPRDARTLDARIDAILARPEFKHTLFGIEFYSLDTNTPIYTLNADKLFVPGSTTKLVTMGSALQLLGADYRFRTRVYRTGELDARGTLEGDLVLVASGDPNLSGRIRDGGTLALENIDHSYGGPDSHGHDGDPLAVVRKLAADVSARGVKRVSGRVIVDATLFPEGERDGGTGFVISPIIVNDNAIDILLTPTKEGERAAFRLSPHTAYATFINATTTARPGSAPSIHVESDVAHGDGTHTVTIGGAIPADTPSFMYAYRVPQPSRFAEIVLAEALHERGIVAAPREASSSIPVAQLSRSYTTERVVAEHVSPPFAEEVKITLKLSQNLHASATPLLLGALGGPTTGDVEAVAARGFTRMRQFLDTTGADVSGASQSDGAGADAHFTPDFMVHYLAFMAKQQSAKAFHDALPILGRDGTLWNVQVKSPAAGHVFAKTGTYSVEDLLHDGIMVNGKGLAGYLTTADGRHLAFAIYANNIPLKDPAAVTPVVGEALGEIAAAAYDARPPRS